MTSKITLLKEIKNKVGKNKVTQSELADRVGLKQPRISKILKGSFREESASIKKICMELNIQTQEGTESRKGDAILASALARNWDGSEEQAQILARILDEIGSITSLRKTKEERGET